MENRRGGSAASSRTTINRQGKKGSSHSKGRGLSGETGKSEMAKGKKQIGRGLSLPVPSIPQEVCKQGTAGGDANNHKKRVRRDSPKFEREVRIDLRSMGKKSKWGSQCLWLFPLVPRENLSRFLGRTPTG